MQSELLTVCDVAGSVVDRIHWLGEFAWCVLAVLRIAVLVYQTAMHFRDILRGGRTPRKRTRARRNAGWTSKPSVGRWKGVTPDVARGSNIPVYSLAYVGTLLYYCDGNRNSADSKGKRSHVAPPLVGGARDGPRRPQGAALHPNRRADGEGKPTMQLTTGTVRRITGASQRQLTYWDGTGFLKPGGKGTGHRRYTFPDVVAVKTVMALRRQGCSLQQIRKAVEHLRKRYPHDAGPDVLASLTLLTDGKSVYMLTDARQVMDVMSKQTACWIVNLGKLIVEARQAMRTLPLEWVEPVTVRNQGYRLRVTHDAGEGGYVVQCVELPGAIEQGETADEAIDNGKAAIESVVVFLAKRAGAHGTRRVKRSA